MEAYRQGDVVFIKINPDNIPTKLTDENTKTLQTRIVRRGENGGLHKLEAKDDVLFMEFQPPPTNTWTPQPQAVRYIDAPTGVKILGRDDDKGHHEHMGLSLPAGIYELRIQSEQRGQFRSMVID